MYNISIRGGEDFIEIKDLYSGSLVFINDKNRIVYRYNVIQLSRMLSMEQYANMILNDLYSGYDMLGIVADLEHRYGVGKYD